MDYSKVKEENLTIKTNDKFYRDNSYFEEKEYPIPFRTLIYEWRDLVDDFSSGDWRYYDVKMEWVYIDENDEKHVLKYFHKSEKE